MAGKSGGASPHRGGGWGGDGTLHAAGILARTAAGAGGQGPAASGRGAGLARGLGAGARVAGVLGLSLQAERARQAEARAERIEGLDRRRQEWSAVVAHELRQPLSVVTMYAAALERSGDGGSRARPSLARVGQ